MEQTATLTVRIEADEADAEELEDMTRQLLMEVKESTDVERADLAAAGDAPVGAKAGRIADLGTLVVQALPAALPGLLGVLHSWVSRPRQFQVRVKIRAKGGSVDLEFPVGAMTHDHVMDFVSIITRREPPDRRPGARRQHDP